MALMDQRNMQRSISKSDRRYFLGGSDARIVMGDDEPALLRLWREKRGEAEPEDLSGNLVVSESKPHKAPSQSQERESPSDGLPVTDEGLPTSPTPTNRIDKSVLALPLPRRLRDKNHLRFVAAQPCLVCGRQPCDAHHLRFAQSRGLGLKVSDEFTVPLCRVHHRELHQSGKEVGWWARTGIEPIDIAQRLWTATRPNHSDAAEPAPSQAGHGQKRDLQFLESSSGDQR
jgi:hypothetical protein